MGNTPSLTKDLKNPLKGNSDDFKKKAKQIKDSSKIKNPLK